MRTSEKANCGRFARDERSAETRSDPALLDALRRAAELGAAAARGELGLHAACLRARRACREAVSRG